MSKLISFVMSTLICLPPQVAASQKQSALFLSDLVWQHRVVVMVGAEGSELFDQVQAYQYAYACEIKDRDILFLKAVHGTKQWQALPSSVRERFGLHLIGYDGGIKDYSSDAELLGRLDFVIDQMPMRKRELADRGQTSPC